MALARRNGQRFEANIWPGFVDAMTALLLVLVFVLSIFMMVQFMLNETITTQDSELDELSGQVASLADALGLERDRGAALQAELDSARDERDIQAALVASLAAQNAEQSSRIVSFEEQVAGLLSQQSDLETRIATLTGERDSSQAALAEAEAGNAVLVARIEDIEAGLAREISEKEAAQLALAQAREEVDASAETARLAAARTEALQALIDDLEEKSAAQGDALETAEAARLADAAAAEALRARLENADAELTAMSLALEEKRQQAEDTLTLLAAANAIEEDLNDKLLRALSDSQGAESEVDTLRSRVSELEGEVARLNTAANLADNDTSDLESRLLAALAAQRAAEASSADALTQAEQRDVLLQTANEALSREQAASAESQRQIEALNQQVAALRQQLSSLQALLDDAGARDADADVQISALGSQLNSALAQVAAEQRKLAEEQRVLAEERARRLELEEAERRRLEAESQDLQNYRSEFFGRLRLLLGDQEGVRIDGDRFVFSSEVLFQPAKADLSAEGRAEIAKVADILLGVADDIPDELNWVIRVDGHTDNLPLSGTGEFSDNWELSQARALSVVRYMSGSLGIPPERLAANGFGEYQPVNIANTPAARAQNRRIELKLTEK
jgi:chemotaxis protein MotB